MNEVLSVGSKAVGKQDGLFPELFVHEFDPDRPGFPVGKADVEGDAAALSADEDFHGKVFGDLIGMNFYQGGEDGEAKPVNIFYPVVVMPVGHNLIVIIAIALWLRGVAMGKNSPYNGEIATVGASLNQVFPAVSFKDAFAFEAYDALQIAGFNMAIFGGRKGVF